MTTVQIQDILPRTQIIATGGQTTFSTNWTANAASDVLVYQRGTGVPANDSTQLLSPSLYTVAFIGAGATVQVTLNSGATLGDIITIIRDTPSDFVNFYSNTNFTPQMINNDNSIFTMVDQQNELVNQEIAPRYNYSELLNQNAATEDTILPLLGANQAWVKDPTNNFITTVTIPSSGPAPSSSKYILQSADAGLPNAYVLTAGTGIGFTLGTGTLTVSLSTPVSLANGGTNANLTATVNNLVYSTASAMALLATANNGVLVTSNTGVPSISTTIPTATQSNITQLGVQTQALNMGTHAINNVVDPTNPQDAATKNYVDTTALNGTSVYAATASNLTVTQSGAGVGATLTNAGAQATLSIDGVNPPVGVNVLVKNIGTGGTAANYGIYTVTNVGSGSSNWVLTRSTQYDTATQINNTGLIIVQNGTVNGGTAWYNSATIVTVDTTNFNYTEFGNIVFPINLAHGGTNANLTASNGGIFYSTASAGAILSGTTTANQILMSGASSAPAWSTATYPATATKGDLHYASANNVISGLGIGSTGQILTIASGVPAWTTATYPSTAGTSGNILTSDGTNWNSTAPSGTGTVQLIATGTASSSATIDFTGLSSTYSSYFVIMDSIVPQTSTANLNFRISTDGSTYQTSAYFYSGWQVTSAGTTGALSAASAAQILLANSMSNTSTDGLSGIIEIYNPSQSATSHKFTYRTEYTDSGGGHNCNTGGALWNTTTAITAIRFLFSSGNIVSGKFKLYGVLA